MNTWTPVETGSPTWTPASDDDLTFAKRGFLSSDAVKVGDEILTDVLDGLPTLPVDAEDVSVDVSGTPTPLDDYLADNAPPKRPVLASADWWAEASNRFATVVPDRSRWAEHGQPAVTPFEIPDGTYLVGETITDPRRPRVPDHARLTFANGVRAMWRANHGIPNGWQPLDTNPTGYSDIFAHQAVEDAGLTDALEIGLRLSPDDDLVRYFVDEVTAGEDPNAPEGDTQTFSDPLDPELYQGVQDFCVDLTWSGGTRTYEFYIPNPASTDLLTPGEAVEAWELHSTTTRTAGPGFYDSGLPWYLGDSLVLIDYLRLFDLGTGDLALDFQAAEAVGGGWTDEAGNPWTHGDDTTPHVAVAPDDLILLPSTTIPSRAADPGAGDWTLMYDGVIDPAADLYRLGTAGADIVGDTGWGIYVIPAEYGGTQLIFNDGTALVSAPLGITDADRHLIVARLDRTAGTLEVTVDGEAVAVTGDAGALGRIAGVEDFTLAIGTVLRGLAVWSRCLTDDEAAALLAEVAAPADAYDPVGSATGGGATGPTGPAGPAGADGADGQDGADGAPGADGASAYEVAVADGFVGDETAWLASLVGATGATGAKGDKGDKGDTGNTGPAGDPTTVADGAIPQAKVNGLVTALARIGTTVEATSDSTARTSTTYTADGTLQFEGAADTTYRIDAYLIFQGDATADLKVGFSTPAGTMHLTVEGALTTVASGSDYDRFLTLTSSGATTVVGIAGASTPISVRISGVIHLTSAGTVSFGWAPNATGAGTGVTRMARSQLYYRAA